jgi:hypothetical protein
MGPLLFPTVFWCDAPEAGLIGAVSLFKFRRIKHLVVATIILDYPWSLLRGTERVRIHLPPEKRPLRTSPLLRSEYSASAVSNKSFPAAAKKLMLDVDRQIAHPSVRKGG